MASLLFEMSELTDRDAAEKTSHLSGAERRRRLVEFRFPCKKYIKKGYTKSQDGNLSTPIQI